MTSSSTLSKPTNSSDPLRPTRFSARVRKATLTTGSSTSNTSHRKRFNQISSDESTSESSEFEANEVSDCDSSVKSEADDSHLNTSRSTHYTGKPIRISYSVAEKLEILTFAESHSRGDAALKYGVNKSMISRWVQDERKISCASLDCKRVHAVSLDYQAKRRSAARALLALAEPN